MGHGLLSHDRGRLPGAAGINNGEWDGGPPSVHGKLLISRNVVGYGEYYETGEPMPDHYRQKLLGCTY